MIGLSKGSMERKLTKMSLFRECLQDWDLQEGRTTVQQTEALTFIMTAQRLPKSRIFTELMVPSVKYQSNKQKVIASISSPSIIWSSTPFSNSDPTVLESKITRHLSGLSYKWMNVMMRSHDSACMAIISPLQIHR